MRFKYCLVPSALLIAVVILRPLVVPALPTAARNPRLFASPRSPAPSASVPSFLTALPSPPSQPSDTFFEAARCAEEIIRLQNAPAQEERPIRERVIRHIAHLLELAYMAFDQKRFDRCIELCEKILVIDPRYTVALELREDCEKSRHIEGYYNLAAWKLEEWKRTTDDDEQPRIPWSQSVYIPSREEWAEIANRIYEPVPRVEGSQEEDPDMLAIERKLDTMKIDLSFENTKFEDILAFIRDFSGLTMTLDAEIRDYVDPDRIISFKVKDMILKYALRLLLSVVGLDYVVTEEHVVLLTAPYRISVLNQRH